MDYSVERFNLIRVQGTPRWVELDTGRGPIRIHRSREGKVFISGEGFNRYVKCVDYDNYFVGLMPDFDKILGAWFAYCACGSPAVVVGYNAYKHGASAGSDADGMIPGEMLVCFSHAGTGKHLDGSS